LYYPHFGSAADSGGGRSDRRVFPEGEWSAKPACHRPRLRFRSRKWLGIPLILSLCSKYAKVLTLLAIGLLLGRRSVFTLSIGRSH